MKYGVIGCDVRDAVREMQVKTFDVMSEYGLTPFSAYDVE